MANPRINQSISIRPELHAQVNEFIKDKEGVSFSAVVSEALHYYFRLVDTGRLNHDGDNAFNKQEGEK